MRPPEYSILPEAELSTSTALPAASTGSLGRWWAAVGVGTLVSLPLSWLLSYGALLPFFLGVFFFALFGIIIGAAMYRVGAPARPVKGWAVLLGTSFVVLTGWSLSMVKESRDFPGDLANLAIRRTRDIGDRSAAEFKTHVADSVRRILREEFPPGGTLGYIRWSLMDGEIEKGRIDGVSQAMTRPQGRFGWAIRVVLSIALLAFGVASQTFLLRTVETKDGVAATDGAGR